MKKIISIVCLSIIAVTAMAIPARRGPMVRTAEDGTEKTVFLHGNAFYHYMTDEQGTWLDEKSLQPLSQEAKAAKMSKGEARQKARRVQQQKKIGNAPNVAPRGLMIMVNFKDKAFQTPHDTIDSMLNGANFTRKYSVNYTYEGQQVKGTYTCSGSARKYFQDQSYGQYNPVFDVVGPYTLSQNYSYYGKNDDANVGKMIKEACQLAYADGADFSLYDNDNDGNVDFVYVLYAGEGEADGGDANTVWPHNYDLRYLYETCILDGKQICNYACSNEWQHYGQVYNGIGTFCHEFSHVLGLPDLYETNETSRGCHTLYDWDILDYGPYNNDGNTPPAYSAYERFYMGWLTPRVLTEAENVTLAPINEGNGTSLLMCSDDAHNLVGYNPNPKTFYLLENRVRTGWDKYLPGRGMLITKIQYDADNWEYNAVNNDPYDMGVDLIEATPNTTDWSAATDAFPKGATEYTDFTDHEITNIAISGQNITFQYRGGWPEGIESIQPSAVSIQKIIRDGKLYIVVGNALYDATGKRYENHQL